MFKENWKYNTFVYTFSYIISNNKHMIFYMWTTLDKWTILQWKKRNFTRSCKLNYGQKVDCCFSFCVLYSFTNLDLEGSLLHLLPWIFSLTKACTDLWMPTATSYETLSLDAPSRIWSIQCSSCTETIAKEAGQFQMNEI